MKGRKIYILITLVLTILVFAGIFTFFAFFYYSHLHFSEQMQVFFPDPAYFMTYLGKPAFLSRWAGDFLTQFYYFRYGGAAIVTLSLFLLWITLLLLLQKFNSRGNNGMLLLLPVIAGWIALCDIQYALSGIMAMIPGIFSFYFYISIKKETGRLVSGLLLVPMLYYAAGSSVLILAIPAALFELFRNRTIKAAINAASLLALTVTIPLILKEPFFLTAQEAFFWISGMTGKPILYHYFPIIAVIVAIFPVYSGMQVSERYSFITWLPLPLLLFFLFQGISMYASFDLEKILRLDSNASAERWDRVVELSTKYGMKNRVASYYTNMALSQLGLLPEELMDHHQPAATGLFLPVNADQNYLTITLSNEVYWRLGDVNAAQHSALLGMIFSPRSQSSRLLKRLIEINIVNGQYAAAEKFICILERTIFYRKWASEKRKYLYNEDECAGSQWIIQKRSVIPASDLLKMTDQYVVTLRMLADAHPDNHMAIDYLLCFHLLSKDINSFCNDFKKYFYGEDRMLPRAFQEALLIRIASGAESSDAYSRYRFSPVKIKDMVEYTQLFENQSGDGTALQDRFGKTYWFYYHFARLNSEE